MISLAKFYKLIVSEIIFAINEKINNSFLRRKDMKKRAFDVSLFFITLFFGVFIQNCENNSSDQAAKDQQKLLISALAVSGSATNPTAINCSDPAPAFSTLGAAGTSASCAKSGCHNTATAQNGLDMSNYSSVKQRTTTGNPAGSLLYTKITSGSMAGYTNGTINAAVYCWIKGGGGV